ncbi:hypothetical protein M8C13_40370 [Crossiella sp. SN42]|uniref:hypothetical protein n=1 Tax=Crossiella sp. SN42 TaxID=2944808 RepID=UPI00207C1804|nr:hypothetical protein [Crossiella sp. SN42]MCO1582023.1 hypothetical protein [Crossiella sp. SN42]
MMVDCDACDGQYRDRDDPNYCGRCCGYGYLDLNDFNQPERDSEPPGDWDY